MTIADYVILAVILLSGLIGLFRGFFREALSLATWVIAAIVAFQFGAWVAGQLTEYVSTPSVRLAGSYTALFIGTLIIGAIINHFVAKLVKASGFAGTDKLLGLVFGGARGVVIVLIFILLASVTVVSQDPWYRSSLVISYLEPWANWMKTLVPEDLDQYLEPDAPAQPEENPPGKKSTT